MRRTLIGAIALALGVGSLVGLGSAPASAATTGFVSPVDGATVVEGFHTIKVEMVGQPTGQYWVTVDGCFYDERVDFQHDGTDQLYSLEIPPIDCADPYFFAHLWRGGTEGGSSSIIDSVLFEVVYPDSMPSIFGLNASPQVLYSTVQDGFRDSTRIEWTGSFGHSGRIEILNARNMVVFKRGSYEEDSFVWRGRSSAGNVLPAGTYRVRLTVWNAQNIQTKATRTIYIKRDYASRRLTKTLFGWDSTSDSTSGNCYIDIGDVYGSQTLDCWNGRFAIARYAVTVPANARDIRWSASGETGCCKRGILSRTGKRVSDRKFVVTVKVTGWRSFTVNRVKVSYLTKKWW